MKKLESLIKNLLLRLLVLLNPVKKVSALPEFKPGTRILFIRLNRIGDALVSTPLFTNIRQNSDFKLYVLADRKNHFIFRNNPSIDGIFIFKKGLRGFFGINKILRDNSIDVIVDLHDDVSTSVSYLIALSKVRYKFAFRKENSTLFTHTVEKPDPRLFHIIDRQLQILKLFGLSVNKDLTVPFYNPSDDEKNFAAEILKSLNPHRKLILAINISAGSEARFWGVDNYKRLFNLLCGYDLKIILFAAEREHHYLTEIAPEDCIYPLTGSFGIFAYGIMMSGFIITPDTSVVHLASIKKIPLFGLYVRYRTKDMIWSPYNSDFQYVLTEEPTLKNITYGEVKNKLIPFLEKQLNVTSNTRL